MRPPLFVSQRRACGGPKPLPVRDTLDEDQQADTNQVLCKRHENEATRAPVWMEIEHLIVVGQEIEHRPGRHFVGFAR